MVEVVVVVKIIAIILPINAKSHVSATSLRKSLPPSLDPP